MAALTDVSFLTVHLLEGKAVPMLGSPMNSFSMVTLQQSQVFFCSVGEQAGILPWLDWGYFHVKTFTVVDPKGLATLKIITPITTEIFF